MKVLCYISENQRVLLGDVSGKEIIDMACRYQELVSVHDKLDKILLLLDKPIISVPNRPAPEVVKNKFSEKQQSWINGVYNEITAKWNGRSFEGLGKDTIEIADATFLFDGGKEELKELLKDFILSQDVDYTEYVLIE